MAAVSITEFAEMAYDARGNLMPVGQLPYIASDLLTYTSSTQHTLNAKTRFVRLKANADVYVNEGTNPTSDTDAMFLEADVAEYFGVQAEGTTGRKLSFYDGTS